MKITAIQRALAFLLAVLPAAAALPSLYARSLSIPSTTLAPSGVYYEIFVRSWYDTDGDGIGDLKGVTAKLDYLKSLGVSGIWLMPIQPSPSYHGYDVTDYYGINPPFGTMADFEHLLVEAHKRGIKVIIDLVINHTSNRHPWFVAAQDPHSPYHAWYRWSDARTDLGAIAATGSLAWHATTDGRHYLGVFTSGMPDLDYDTPAVRQEMIRLGRFWLNKGVDGFRLDAAQHIYFDLLSQRDDPAVLQKNLAWWSAFRLGIDAVNPDAYVVGEVTRDDPAQLAPYFRPLSAAFDFPLAKQLIDSAKHERDAGLDALLRRSAKLYRQVSGKPGTDAPFLSNHDQERVISQLDGNVAHMRMAAAMLLTLPGHPFIYYGEELGVQGHKPDPDLREPMRWHRDPHDAGETSWKPFSTNDGAAISVDAEQADRGSLLHFYATLIRWRREIGPLRDGEIDPLEPVNPHVVGWQLDDSDSHMLVLHNLSAATQSLPLRARNGRHFATVLRQTGHGAAIHDGYVILPPYSSVILQ